MSQTANCKLPTAKDPLQIEMFCEDGNWIICYSCGYTGHKAHHDEFHARACLREKLK